MGKKADLAPAAVNPVQELFTKQATTEGMTDGSKRRIEFGSPGKGASPSKEHIDKIRRMMESDTASAPPGQPAQGSADASSSGSGQIPASSIDIVLAAIADLRLEMSTKLENVAMKSDLDTLRQNISAETKVAVAHAVDPLKSEMHDYKLRVEALEKHRSTPPTTLSSKSLATLQASINKWDPANRRIAFTGWPDEIPAVDRISQIRTFMADKFQEFRVVDADNFYSGPPTDRKLSKTSFVELASASDQHKFLKKAVDQTFRVNGVPLAIKRARTDFQNKRNFSVRKAEEIIKSSDAARGQTIEVLWLQKVRQVTVDGVVAFSQPLDEVGGSFLGLFSDLVLP
jgi:protein subunit release factor B